MGTPKSECFLGERKHSEALSFLSKAKKRLAELRADEVVGRSLAGRFAKREAKHKSRRSRVCNPSQEGM